LKSEFSMRQGQRIFTAADIEQIQQTFRRFPALSRTELIGTVCENFNWLTTSGLPKTGACKKLFAQMEVLNLINLPPPRSRGSVRRSPPKQSTQTDPQPIEDLLKNVTPISVMPVSTDADRHLWNEYVQRYHPLGYKQPFGYHLRYAIRSNEQYLGCLLISGASRSIASRDIWIGWTDDQRRSNLSWIVNNSRYLIFPWVKIPHLASHALGQVARRIAGDWEKRWGFSPLLLETFVDPIFFSGTCYKAAGWQSLGKTTGRGLAQPGKSYKSSPKLIFVKPLSKQYRPLLCSTLQGRTEL